MRIPFTNIKEIEKRPKSRKIQHKRNRAKSQNISNIEHAQSLAHSLSFHGHEHPTQKRLRFVVLIKPRPGQCSHHSQKQNHSSG